MTHVAVIGCGVVGAAIAYELSKIDQFTITLLDQNTPASGATGAALGIMMAVISHKVKGRAWQLRHTSLQRYESLIPELETLTGITIPYHRQGIVKLTTSPKELAQWQELVKIRSEQGLSLEIWDPLQIEHHCPHINLDNNQIIAALYSPQDRQVNPSILTQALVKAAAKNGVNCLFNVQVTDLISGSSPQLHTSQGTISVDKVVIAAGIGSTPLFKSVIIRPVLGQAMHLKLDQSLGKPEFQPIITGNDVHILPLGGGEYWLGATVEFTPDPQQLVSVKAQAIAFCPGLAPAVTLSTWSGLRPRPDDRPAPVIESFLGDNKIILASGHYRNGVMLAPATAIAVLERLTA
ncbi:FAD-binding oxidoreductase [Gloeocapsa sp. PCC 73106]|uniref:NAD(P)/FAD-dependent oxidoreductase n=1 Tax=Gloeocapsa sp. PCC 73106 TaxID=102232 RepID=UPI0002ABE9FE|nr:FAD-dependent oxidoreductase [Gloeocapsa sp. PCC 73106]ELR99629.1 glycine/D-amino acid oxidase, deaminating [Gloeocapsa sp. PCC 73106]